MLELEVGRDFRQLFGWQSTKLWNPPRTPLPTSLHFGGAGGARRPRAWQLGRTYGITLTLGPGPRLWRLSDGAKQAKGASLLIASFLLLPVPSFHTHFLLTHSHWILILYLGIQMATDMLFYLRSCMRGGAALQIDIPEPFSVAFIINLQHITPYFDFGDVCGGIYLLQ